MEADDSDSESVEYNFETQPDSVGFMVLTSQSESQPRNTEDADIMQIWPALQQGEERKVLLICLEFFLNNSLGCVLNGVSNNIYVSRLI